MNANNYGEPWKWLDAMEQNVIIDVKGNHPIKGSFYIADKGQMQRAVLCVNACADIPDPAAAIQAAMNAIADLLAIARIKWGNLDADANKIMENAENALKLLTPSKPILHGVHSACWGGEGWELYDANGDAIEDWPQGWADTVSASFLKSQGVEVAP